MVTSIKVESSAEVESSLESQESTLEGSGNTQYLSDSIKSLKMDQEPLKAKPKDYLLKLMAELKLEPSRRIDFNRKRIVAAANNMLSNQFGKDTEVLTEDTPAGVFAEIECPEWIELLRTNKIQESVIEVLNNYGIKSKNDIRALDAKELDALQLKSFQKRQISEIIEDLNQKSFAAALEKGNQRTSSQSKAEVPVTEMHQPKSVFHRESDEPRRPRCKFTFPVFKSTDDFDEFVDEMEMKFLVGKFDEDEKMPLLVNAMKGRALKKLYEVLKDNPNASYDEAIFKLRKEFSKLKDPATAKVKMDTLKWDGTSNPAKHINKLKELAEVAFGGEVLERDIREALVKSIPKELYMHVDGSDKSIKNAEDAMWSYYRRTLLETKGTFGKSKTRSDRGGRNNKENKKTDKQKNGTNKSSGEGKKCYVCSEKGHLSYDCPKKKQKGSSKAKKDKEDKDDTKDSMELSSVETVKVASGMHGPKIPVTFEGPKGRVTVKLLVDTGASSLLISRKIRDVCGWESYPRSIKLKGASGRTVGKSSQSVELRGLVDGQKFHTIACVVDFEPEESIIGMQVLKSISARIHCRPNGKHEVLGSIKAQEVKLSGKEPVIVFNQMNKEERETVEKLYRIRLEGYAGEQRTEKALNRFVHATDFDEDESEQLVPRLFERINDQLDDEKRKKLENLLRKHRDVFSKNEKDLGKVPSSSTLR